MNQQRLTMNNKNQNDSLRGSNHHRVIKRKDSLSSSSHALSGSSFHNRNNNYQRTSPQRHQSCQIQRKSFSKPTKSFSNHDPLGNSSNHSKSGFQHSYKKPLMPAKQAYLACDCEMVQTVSGQSVAARIVLIDWKGRTVLDSYLKPKEQVEDYRTFVSGIKQEHLEDAPEFDLVVEQAKELLADKILVGHGVDNDLKSLGIDHPWLMRRDTAYYQPFMQLLEHNRADPSLPQWGPRKLKELAKEKLSREIQVPGASHCPIEDAVAALDLYKSHRPRWEACMSNEEKRQRQQCFQMMAAQAAHYGGDLDSSMHSYYSTSSNNYGLDGSNHHYNNHRRSSYNGIYHSKNSNDSLDAHSYHYPRSSSVTMESTRPSLPRRSSLQYQPNSNAYQLHQYSSVY